MDGHPTTQQSFSDVFDEFYITYAKAKNLPFTLGEITILNRESDNLKEY